MSMVKPNAFRLSAYEMGVIQDRALFPSFLLPLKALHLVPAK